MNNQTASNNYRNKNILTKNMPNQNSSQTISKQKQRVGLVRLAGSANKSYETHIQRVSNDVINFSKSADENNDQFILKKKQKRNLSSTDTPNPEPKKVKPLFTTVNRFAPLSIEDTVMENTENVPTSHDNLIPSNDQYFKRKRSPQIYVCDILDFVEVRNEQIKLIGTDTFTCKSSTNDLKIQTSHSKYYCEVVHFLKDSEVQYHTY